MEGVMNNKHRLIYQQKAIPNDYNSRVETFVYCLNRAIPTAIEHPRKSANFLEIGLGFETFDGLQIRHFPSKNVHYLEVAALLLAPEGIELATGPSREFFSNQPYLKFNRTFFELEPQIKEPTKLGHVIVSVMERAFPLVSYTEMDKYGFGLVKNGNNEWVSACKEVSFRELTNANGKKMVEFVAGAPQEILYM